MKLKCDIVFQKVGANYVAVAVGDDSARCPGVIVLNDSARDIAERLRTEKSRDVLIAELLDDYDATAEEIAPYVDETLEYLKDIIDE